MAYSTQRQFFKHNLDFPNDERVCHCKTKLKRYASTLDNRAWGPHLDDRSRFLSDLVTCELNKTNSDSDFEDNYIRSIEAARKERKRLENNQARHSGSKSGRRKTKQNSFSSEM